MKQRLEKYQKKKEEIREKLWFRFFNQVFNLILALGTVIPLLYRICTTIPFSYEVNDDAVIVQILDGSFTGSPEAHGIFIRYPLSMLITYLYRRNPRIDFRGIHLSNVNWYIGVIVLLYGFGMTMVVYRLLNHFRCNRFLICFGCWLGFTVIWLPCFSKVTFTTASAFFGCTALMYLALESREEAWRPWNLAVLAILMTASYCMRTQCFYMVLPFLAVEMVLKFNLEYFRSLKPWITTCVIALICAGIFCINDRAYASTEWKDYRTYNHARAYLQDFAGFPEYEENKDFYVSLGLSEEQRDAMALYTYCLSDDFTTDWVMKTYDHVKSKEENKSWKEKILASKEEAWDNAINSRQAHKELRFYAFYFCLVLVPLIPVTLVLRFRTEIGEHLLYILQTAIYACLVAAEWIYLTINGRFPQRVEECILLMTMTAALVMICHFLQSYREVRLFRIHGVLQVILLAVALHFALPYSNALLENVKGNQEYLQIYGAEKGEVLKYCGNHPDNYYILDTNSFNKMSLPTDDTRQMNWFMSGSWTAYSPLYTQKLENAGTDCLSS
ncbi:MAG: hypothetical protein IKX76_03605, partial [Eubacterium sp.]|nr:hypothetical protein [Eubacterium sp.]